MDTTIAPLASICIDIGKEVFHLVGFGTDGKIAFRRKFKRLACESAPRIAPPSYSDFNGLACRSASRPRN
jgi:hypothetical protein